MEILKGIPVSPGFAIAEAFVIASRNLDIPRRFINESEVERERDRFFAAVKVAQDDIRALQNRMEPEIGGEAAPIFDAHVMILADSSLHDEVIRRIIENRFSAEYAVSRSLRKFEKAFYSIEDQYLAQRVADIQDIEQRLLRALLGERTHELEELKKRVVLVAHNLTPSEIASIDPNYVMGFCTDVGGSTGHTAIVARAMEIPAVVGLRGISGDISQGDTIIIDGNRGVVIINPDSETIVRYRGIADDFHQFEQALYSEKDLPTVTTDGVKAVVMGNIEFPREIEQVINSGGKGVALYRTEFLYLASKKAPDEEIHYQAYCKAVKHLNGRPITIRTLDLGADKFFQKEAPMHENNPQLGCRAVRYCLLRPDIFRTQIRAICRASAHGQVSMMIPMVSNVEEVRRTLDLLREIQDELSTENIPFDENMPIGIMVEVPAVAITMDAYIDLVDFFSIGTNDLIQYTLAVDRTNEHVADLYKPSHPAVLTLVKNVIAAGLKYNKPVSMCGEMCADPIFVPFLLGVGLRTFSVPPPLIPEVKKLIRSVSISQAEEIAAKVFTYNDSRDISAYLRNTTREIVPDWAFM
ncbi:MAG: phosphoenolpyruvate--protein phosphotransferase [Planctomycetes bacterium]|nr:phosphoenolpyruvate--protein phosphotransferase [Planctomycetota bacterium]